MSIRSLYIGYAKVECTTEQVKNKMDEFFQENLVSGVDERIRKDSANKPFKIFFIHFSKVNVPLQKFFDALSKVPFLRIHPWTVLFNNRNHLKNETSFLKEKDDTYWTDLSNEFY
jgi:hypothetical protein